MPVQIWAGRGQTSQKVDSDERTEIWNRVTRRPRLAEEEVSEM